MRCLIWGGNGVPQLWNNSCLSGQNGGSTAVRCKGIGTSQGRGPKEGQGGGVKGGRTRWIGTPGGCATIGTRCGCATIGTPGANLHSRNNCILGKIEAIDGDDRDDDAEEENEDDGTDDEYDHDGYDDEKKNVCISINVCMNIHIYIHIYTYMHL